MQLRRFHATAAALALLAFGAVGAGTALAANSGPSAVTRHHPEPVTATPIKHLVVIFDENVSFDHYFGTYPYAANQPGETPFVTNEDTPTVNGLYSSVVNGKPTGPLLTHNPNGANPPRFSPNDPMTCDQDHGYTDEQTAADHGAEDTYPASVGHSLSVTQCLTGFSFNGTPEVASAGQGSNPAVLGYYDGNTVTALWNYAQHFAMSDNSYGTNFGPSTPGAFNVTAGQTYGALCGPTSATINDSLCAAPPGLNTANLTASNITTSASGPTSVANQPAAGPGTTFSDADPIFDICTYLPSADGGDNRAATSTLTMGGNNIGEELTSAGLTWGWFQGGFDNGFVPGHGTAPTTAQICAESHKNVGGNTVIDYNPHHEPFQYWASTANPMHVPPTSVAMIGHNDQANHQYDTADFWAAADSGNLPDVSYLKAPDYQDGHAGYSDPVDEQNWLVSTINHLQTLNTWKSTAVVIAYDDSDGWYDHVLAPVTSASQTSLDTLTGAGQCGPTALIPTNSSNQPEQGRCGLGPRLPLLVISRYAKPDFVDNALTDQSSVVKFIEDNWNVPALGNGSTDTSAGSLDLMFDFNGHKNSRLFLNTDGTISGH
ncbi:MAG TPA: alkaline phosphatase family protein [Streptosporangiaceae bacterium]|nr:alkaline phosphatase family protein [Streptosporangiaceae bacterium]